MRPPGHHADYGSARGFCLFNNVALAAAYALKKHRLERVAIVDFDVHHGNERFQCQQVFIMRHLDITMSESP